MMNWQTKEVIDWLDEDKDLFSQRYHIDVSNLTASDLEKEVRMLLIIKGRIVQTAAIDYLKNQAVKQLLNEVTWEEVVKALQKEDVT